MMSILFVSSAGSPLIPSVYREQILLLLYVIFYSIFLLSLYLFFKKHMKFIAVGVFLVIFVIYIPLFYFTYTPETPYPVPLPSVSISLTDSPESLDNGAQINQLVSMFLVQKDLPGPIERLSFYVKNENDTNWTKLIPPNNYTSGPVTLENSSKDNYWDIGESVILSEPTPDWMTSPEKLYVKIVHEPSSVKIYEGSVYVS